MMYYVTVQEARSAMAQRRDRPIHSKPSTKSSIDQSSAPAKQPAPHIDLAQAIRREIDRAIG
jgi:hypothetical protein